MSKHLSAIILAAVAVSISVGCRPVGEAVGDTTRTIVTGHEGGARRTAERVGNVAVVENHAAAGEAVEMGRGDVFATVKPDVGESVVVGDDEQDVRPWCGGGGGRGRRGE